MTDHPSPGLIEATYDCVLCGKDHTRKFVAPYKPLRKWLLTCPHCRKYTLVRMVGLVIDGVRKRVTTWHQYTRGRAAA